MTTLLAIKTDGAEESWKIQTSTSGNQLYFHIPFCKQKCPYCHFFVVRDQDKAPFLNALRKEVSMQRSLFGSIRSIYFGGGTPSLLTPKELASIITIPSGIEVTLEANPDDLTPDYLSALLDIGINRLSIGIQSFDETNLIQIGRNHTAKKALSAIELASHYIPNISIDLMYDLPSQTLSQWQKTLSHLANLPITHLSLYNMTIEENTAFYRKRKQLTLPTEEESFAYHQAALETIPLPRYEISAFAKPQHEAIHNTGYWEGRPFFGLGPSAFSYQNGARYQNAPNLKTYIDTIQQGALPIAFHERLPFLESQRELLAVALRLFRGVKLQNYHLTPQTHADIHTLIQEGYLSQNERLQLTPKGALFYNEVASTLI